jgi:hypothetical protein
MRIHEIIESAADAFDQALKGPAPKGPGAMNAFAKGVKKGYTGTRKTVKNLPYTKLGRAATGALNYFQKVNKGPNIK